MIRPCSICGLMVKNPRDPERPVCSRHSDEDDGFALEAPKLREADVLKAVTGFLVSLGWIVRRMYPGTWVPYHEHRRELEEIAEGRKPERLSIPRQLHENADPDLLCVHARYGVVWLEVKAPGRKPTREQMSKIQVLRKEGYRAWWVDSLEALREVYDTELRNE